MVSVGLGKQCKGAVRSGLSLFVWANSVKEQSDQGGLCLSGQTV